MKVIILVAIFIFANSISLSNSAYCACQCCLTDPYNPDCQPINVGNASIPICSDDPTICKTRCEAQFPTQCGANNSLVYSNCISNDTTTVNPTPATTVFYGPFQCTCECCPVAPCDVTVQGNVVVDKCADCGSGCAQQYPSACGPPAIVAAATCEPIPSNTTWRTVTTGSSTSSAQTSPSTITPLTTASSTATATSTQPSATTREPHSSGFILRESPPLITLLITSILIITNLYFKTML